MDVGSLFQKDGHYAGVPPESSLKQSCSTIEILGINVSPPFKEKRHHLRLSGKGRKIQRGRTEYGIRGADIRTVIQKGSDHRLIAPQGSLYQRCCTVIVTEIHICSHRQKLFDFEEMPIFGGNIELENPADQASVPSPRISLNRITPYQRPKATTVKWLSGITFGDAGEPVQRAVCEPAARRINFTYKTAPRAINLPPISQPRTTSH